jgi:hypothetical protein
MLCKFLVMKNYFLIIFPSLLLVVFLLIACKEEYVYTGTLNPDNPKDTTTTTGGTGTGMGTTVITKPCSPDSVYFEQSVLPLLRSQCASPGCHDAASRKEGVILDSYANILKTGNIRVNSPANSKIYTVLSKSDPEERMPPAPNSALSNTDKALILKWIQQGAKNLTCDAACDTTQIAFKANIQPILDAQCKGCHSGSSPSGKVALTTYAEIKKYVDSGSLLGSILHAKGYAAMPQGGKMGACEIAKVRNWIRKGALNN